MAIETELAAPAFLIAVPQLGDPNFNRGVVLMLEHSDEGSMGLVINRPTELDMGEFCASQNLTFAGDPSTVIHQGGPVQTDRAFILHISDHEGPETEQVVDGLKLSYSLESLRMLTDEPPTALQIYLGYAGWAPGQLAEEVTSGAWLVATPSKALIFSPDSGAIWELALRELGIDPVQLMHSGAVH
jgi:putative transcriptional regulator